MVNGSQVQNSRRETYRGIRGVSLGLQGVVVGEGGSYEDALADVKSAIRFHIETFGEDALYTDSPVLEAFVDETTLSA